MPYIAAMIIGLLAQAMGSLVGRVLLALGVAFITYKGLDVGLDLLKSTVVTNMQGIGGDAVRFLAWMNIDRGIAMVFSAMAASLALRAAGGGITSMVFKK